jgi:hypothetical protein
MSFGDLLRAKRKPLSELAAEAAARTPKIFTPGQLVIAPTRPPYSIMDVLARDEDTSEYVPRVCFVARVLPKPIPFTYNGSGEKKLRASPRFLEPVDLVIGGWLQEKELAHHFFFLASSIYLREATSLEAADAHPFVKELAANTQRPDFAPGTELKYIRPEYCITSFPKVDDTMVVVPNYIGKEFLDEGLMQLARESGGSPAIDLHLMDTIRAIVKTDSGAGAAFMFNPLLFTPV